MFTKNEKWYCSKTVVNHQGIQTIINLGELFEEQFRHLKFNFYNLHFVGKIGILPTCEVQTFLTTFNHLNFKQLSLQLFAD